MGNLIFKTNFFILIWQIVRQLSRMLICLRICSKMLSISQPKLLRNSTLKRILPLSSRRNSTRNTTQPGIALWVETSVHTLPTKPSTHLFLLGLSRHPSLQIRLSRLSLDDHCDEVMNTV